MPATSQPGTQPSPQTTAPAAIQIGDPPVEAHYYEILDRTGARRAGLTVLLDNQTCVTRAELCYYERYQALEPVQEEIFERAIEVVKTYYQASGLSSDLTVVDGALIAKETIRPANDEPIYRVEPRLRLWPYAAAYSAIVLALLLFGLVNRTLARPAATTTMTERPSVVVQNATPAVAAASAIGAEAGAAAGDAALAPNMNGLAPSTNADARLSTGSTVRIRPGLRSFVRSEPGPDSGVEVGFLQDGASATILGGPTWLMGESDTIVWWYVETDAGVRGWTPANTSQLTLLELVE